MSTNESKSEIEFIKAIVEKTNQHIDAQGFHFVHWGLIVLLWYPTNNYLRSAGYMNAYTWLIVGAIVLGIVLSSVRGARAAGRMAGENTFISKQIIAVCIGCIGGGMVLSGVSPGSGWIDGQDVPILWGLVYANLAFMMGVVYNREFLVAGVCIFAGSIVAMFLRYYQGYILGPVMGLGILIPGLRAEARAKAIMGQPATEVAA